jgi:hypothetical protein
MGLRDVQPKDGNIYHRVNYSLLDKWKIKSKKYLLKNREEEFIAL